MLKVQLLSLSSNRHPLQPQETTMLLPFSLSQEPHQFPNQLLPPLLSLILSPRGIDATLSLGFCRAFEASDEAVHGCHELVQGAEGFY